MDMILFPSLSGDDRFYNVHLVLELPKQKRFAFLGLFWARLSESLLLNAAMFKQKSVGYVRVSSGASTM
jgi:hypothetical protein